MSAKTDFLENELIDHVLRNSAYTPPATVYLALFTTATADDGTGTEVSGGSYARQAVTFSAASGGATANSAEILFPVATGNWGTITHGAIYDALTAGNMLYHGALAASKTINTGEQLRIPAGDLDLSET